MMIRASLPGIVLALLTVMAPVKADTATAHHRLFYIGLALYPESWSENDVVALSDELQRTSDFQTVPLIASNLITARRIYPVADNATIASIVRSVAERAASDDLVVVHISTHGAPGLLASRIGNHPTTAVTGQALASRLAPLAGHNTVVILSACYSGSLIDALRAPDRIIMTAARADRSSFGCAAGNRHTFFGDAELDGFAQPHRSLRQVFAAIRDDVARMERADDYTPSEPQVFVGADVRGLYEAPVF